MHELLQVVYAIINCEEPDACWGRWYATAEEALTELREAHAHPAEYGTGWYIAECRPLATQLRLFESEASMTARRSAAGSGGASHTNCRT